MKIKLLILIFFLIVQIGIGQSLEDYLKQAEVNNPEIEYYELNYKIYREKVDETGNLDNTKFSLGYFILPPETRLGAQRVKLGAQQSFPWPGTFEAQKEVARYRSGEKYYDIDITKLNLFFNIKKTYYELYKNAAVLEVYKENKEILDIYEKMALGALENNKARMSDVLKIQTQKNELHSKIFSAFNDLKAISKQFNRLLDRDENKQLYVPDSMSILDIIIPNDSIGSHPVLEKIDAKKKVFEKEKELVAFEEKPKFTVSLDYISVNKRDDIFPDGNGRDIIMPMVGVSVPIFTKQYDAKSSRLALSVKKTEIEKYNREKEFKTQLDLAKAKIKNAILQVVAAQKNKEEIQRAIDSDLKAYETGKLDYDNILRMQLQKIKYQLLEIQGTKDAYVQYAILEYLLNK